MTDSEHYTRVAEMFDRFAKVCEPHIYGERTVRKVVDHCQFRKFADIYREKAGKAKEVECTSTTQG